MKRLFSLITLSAVILLFTECKNATADKNEEDADQEAYRCLPCGSDCDTKTFKSAGKCPDCNMELVRVSTIVFNTIEPDKLCDYIAAHPNTILLDVRTEKEFEGKADPDFGALKNAINIPIQQLRDRIGELEPFKSRDIIVYCSHSHRSPQVSYHLTQQGFSSVSNMAGGMSELKDKTCVR